MNYAEQLRAFADRIAKSPHAMAYEVQCLRRTADELEQLKAVINEQLYPIIEDLRAELGELRKIEILYTEAIVEIKRLRSAIEHYEKERVHRMGGIGSPGDEP